MVRLQCRPAPSSGKIWLRNKLIQVRISGSYQIVDKGEIIEDEVAKEKLKMQSWPCRTEKRENMVTSHSVWPLILECPLERDLLAVRPTEDIQQNSTRISVAHRSCCREFVIGNKKKTGVVLVFFGRKSRRWKAQGGCSFSGSLARKLPAVRLRGKPNLLHPSRLPHQHSDTEQSQQHLKILSSMQVIIEEDAICL
jgi:hypothetical protein